MRAKQYARQIWLDVVTDRLVLGDAELHCGDVVEVLMPTEAGGKWHECRVEYEERWVLCGLPGVRPVGLWAREVKS